jgi:hypothetical protein
MSVAIGRSAAGKAASAYGLNGVRCKAVQTLSAFSDECSDANRRGDRQPERSWQSCEEGSRGFEALSQLNV